MRKNLICQSIAITAVLILATSCNEKETATTTDNTEVGAMPPDSTIVNDSTILSDDSATVKTAVGVQDEEQNAIKREKMEAEKLKEDEQKRK